MKFNKVTTVLLFLCFSIFAQQKITVDEIYKGAFRAKGMDELSSMKNTNQYTVLNCDRSSGSMQIDLYDFASLKKVATIIDTKNFSELSGIDSYTFNTTETQVLIANNSNKIFRHSFTAAYFLFDIANKKLTKLFDFAVQEPLFSPDGTKIAFAKSNNLYVYDIASKQTKQITTDGKKNHIINGITDWVYEEEFAFVRAFDWSADSKKLAFIRFDETLVPEFSMAVYHKDLYPTIETFKYPKAGEKNSMVSSHLYRLDSNKTIDLNLSGFKNYYIPNVNKTAKADEIILITSERLQNASDVLKVNTKTGAVQKLFTETDEKWVDTDNVTLEFLDDNSFIWGSERDGNRHLYWYDETGKLKKQITKGNWEVTDYYGFNPKTKEVLVQTTEKGSINKVVSKINIENGKSQLISNAEGNNSASFSGNYNYFIETSSTAAKPYTYVLKDGNGKTVKELQNNNELLKKLQDDNLAVKEFMTIPNEVGDQMNAWILKPKNFDKNKKYPVFMYQYSGPGSQSVSNSWDAGNGLWFNHLVQKGYIVVCVDGRGTGYKGTKYKKSTYLNLGKYEIEDQIAAAKWLGTQSYVDKSRIGIFGWSYGGYMASLALTKGADVFKTGIAVAPVTNWRYYDSVYTERFLRTPQENPKGYDENSPTTYANLLKGKFLMIHGTADDNVHFQNAMEFSEALIQNKKQFEFMAYPDKNHGIYGGQTRPQLYQKMTDFLLENL